MYSQNDEEKYITEYFKNINGKFLDIGGYNPFKFSNTRKLYEMGWSGIYIEPSPICFKNFVDEYANEPKIELINKAVTTTKNNKIKFYESNGDAVSTTHENHRDKWQSSGANFNEIEVDTISISDIEEQYKFIDFISLDVESTNFEIFQAFSDNYLSKLKMICIEHDGNISAIQNRLQSLNFKLTALNPENIIMSK